MTTPNLHNYSELTPVAKANARACIVYEQEKAYRASFNAYKLHRTTSSLNARINKQCLKRLVNALAVVRRFQTAPILSLEKVIEENLCRFDEQGNQYLFLERTFVCIDNHAEKINKKG